MRRVLPPLVATAILMAVLPATALAEIDGGEGWLGENNDKMVTLIGFFVIIMFPTVAFLASLVQWRLDKRKYARRAANKQRALHRDARGGW